ncbi:hypothetical protein pb186bvf_004355 [Paramecium bursaria]
MNQLYYSLGGFAVGTILLVYLSLKPRQPKKKLKVDDDIPQQKVDQPQLENQEQNYKYTEQEIRQAKERKDRLLQRLNPKERNLVESYFEDRAKKLFSGETKPERGDTLLSLVKYLMYILIVIAIYLFMTLAFGTSNPEEMFTILKMMGFQLLRKLFNK